MLLASSLLCQASHLSGIELALYTFARACVVAFGVTEQIQGAVFCRYLSIQHESPPPFIFMILFQLQIANRPILERHSGLNISTSATGEHTMASSQNKTDLSPVTHDKLAKEELHDKRSKEDIKTTSNSSPGIPLSEGFRVEYTEMDEKELTQQQARGKVERGFKGGDRP